MEYLDDFVQDNILQSRLEQVVIAVDQGEWPPARSIPPFPSELEIHSPAHGTPPGGTPRRDTPTPMSAEEQQLAEHIQGAMQHALQHAHQQGLSITRATLPSPSAASSNSSKKRKRHIAIDVETERGNFSFHLHSFLSTLT
jgi:hypothetical protein